MKKYLTERTAYHCLLGLDIGYILYLLGFNLNNFPLTEGRWNNAFVFGINFLVGIFICWLWDRWQIKKLKVKNADITVDTIKCILTGAFAVFGGLLGMLYSSWIIAIPFTLLSAYLIVTHYKK